MKIGIRGKLFMVSVLLILTSDLVVGLFSENMLRRWTEQRIEAELRRHAQTVREAVLLVEEIDSIPRMDQLADNFGAAMEKRVTIISSRGEVLGDSQLTEAAVRLIENHGARPEVVAAMANGFGTARRLSATLGQDMLYVAVAFQRENRHGVVRVEVSLTEVDKTIARLRWFIFAAALLGLGVAVLISWVASHLMTRALRSLVANAWQKASKMLGRDTWVVPQDEISGLASSFEQMAGELSSAVKALSRERYRFEAVLEGMSEAVIALDQDLRVTLINRAAFSMLDLKSAPIGRTLREVVPVPNISELTDDLGREKFTAAQFDLPGPDERRILAEAQTKDLSQGAVVVMHDITKIHRLEEMRMQFVANVSHELRTPVSVILGYADTLLDGAMEEEVGREMLYALRQNAVRLSNVIADLLDLSRLDSNRYQLNLESLSVVAEAVQLQEIMTMEARRKNLRIKLDIDPDIHLFADAKAFSQSLLNLLENAVKYTPRGGSVTLRSLIRGERVRIEVQDDGPGIEAEHRARLFERFYRVDKGRSRDAGGTGLGLAIVKSLVEAMEGEVGMEPADPQGSIFWIELPRPTEQPPTR